MAKKVYLKGKAQYLRPYHRDTGENLDDNSDIKQKLMKTDGIYSTMVELPFDNRDDAEEHLNSLGIPTNGLFGNLLKRIDVNGEKKIVYKVVRPHMVHAFEEPLMGHPKVVDADGKEWDKEVLIGNGSGITVKLDVWKGTKATKITWEGIRVDELVPYEAPEEVGF
jgi:hypothetical protein